MTDTPDGTPPRLVIGIDLGTTNSLAAVRAGKDPRVLRDQGADPLTPSMVCFHPDGRTLVGHDAKAQRLEHPERTVFSVKRLIGRSADELGAEVKQLPYRIVASDRGLPVSVSRTDSEILACPVKRRDVKSHGKFSSKLSKIRVL